MCNKRSGTRQHGLSMIELLMFIVVVGVAIAGILSVMNVTTGRSADPLVRKQALAIAESLLEEIELMPFTICDPTDPNAALPTTDTAADCSLAENLGPEPGEARNSIATPLNNVNDYNGLAMNPIQLIGTGVDVPGLAGYAASVAVTPVALAGVQAADSLRITVDVTGPDGVTLSLTGYRLRYAPRSP